MERIGIVGLPNSGKSSLFNALTGGNAAVASHPFSTTETSVGIAQVYDERLLKLAEMSHSRKVVAATIEFADQAGLVAGASAGEGLGNRFLAGIREVDAICLVLRAFEDENVVGDTDPVADLETLELELVLADATTVSNNLDKRRRAAKGDKSILAEVEALEVVDKILQEGTPLWRSNVSADHLAALTTFGLLTAKRVFAVVNIGDDQLDRADEIIQPVVAAFGGGGEVLAVCVQLEAEAAQLDPAGKAELMEGFGLGEGALPRVTRAAYHLLGRRTFLTTGEQESRAWTFRAGAKAPECAGVIHSDLQRGFIRAECIRWDELLELGSWAKAKEAGKLRVEGKEYEVQDGDVLEIRFNV
ncbi:MAG TPA: redox-regulated ATPase YchF [Acidimicrobiales bacterium]|nr:redox-regulated ATPase YchF [Acidimicrobiales bacterium]